MIKKASKDQPASEEDQPGGDRQKQTDTQFEPRIFSTKYVLGALLMVAILVVTILVLFKDHDLKNVLRYISSADIRYLLGGVSMMILYQFCIGESIRLLINAFANKRYPLELTHKTSYIGFYFNAITPSSSGGQPMEMLYMLKRGVDLSHSTIVFILLAICYSVSTLLFAILSLITHFKLVISSLRFIRYFMIAGFIITGVLLTGMILLLARPAIVRKLARGLTALGIKLRLVRRPGRFLRRLSEFNKSYTHTSTAMWKKPVLLIKVVSLHLLQVAALYTVPWFVSLALGGSAGSFGEIFSLQAVLHVSSDFFPTPGAVGLTETGFITMFQSILPANQVMPAMLLTRGINLYGFLILSAVVTLISFFTVSRRPIRK